MSIHHTHINRSQHLLSRTRALAGVLALSLFAEVGIAQTLKPVVIPQDEAPHPSNTTEWWYFTGHLVGVDPQGKMRRYGFEHTTIRKLIPGQGVSAYNGHFAITDLNRQSFKSDMDKVAVQPDVVPPGGGFNITVGSWTMSGSSGSYQLNAAFDDASYSATLSLKQSKPPALHGDKGIIPYDPFGVSAYYSYTNLLASGTIYDHGVPVKVTGLAWQDHQYGDFTDNRGRWDWFSLQLTNGTQYMIYFLYDANENLVRKVGTQVNADGTTIDIDPNALALEKLGAWTSPTTGLTYSQPWRVKVPGGTLNVTPEQANQELTSARGGGYWEGSSTVSGTLNGKSVGGVGYVEVIPVGQVGGSPAAN